MKPEELRDGARLLGGICDRFAHEGKLPPATIEFLARQAVVAAYYAAYHRALEYARDNGYVYSRVKNALIESAKETPGANIPSGVHAALCFWLGEMCKGLTPGQSKSRRELAARLKALSSKRKRASYELGAFNVLVADVLDETDELITLIDQLQVPIESV